MLFKTVFVAVLLTGSSGLSCGLSTGASTTLNSPLSRDTSPLVQPIALDGFKLHSDAASHSEVATTARGGGMLSNIDIPLVAYFFFWYLGNYYYNITNK